MSLKTSAATVEVKTSPPNIHKSALRIISAAISMGFKTALALGLNLLLAR